MSSFNLSATSLGKQVFSRRNVGQFGMVGLVLALLAVFGLVNAEFFSVFFSSGNVANIGRQTTLLLLTAFAMTFVILVGEIDISIGAIASLAGVLIVSLMNGGWPFPLAVLAGLGLGALVGLLNGLITVKGQIPSFIVTLGTLSIVSGLALAMTSGSTIRFSNDAYRDFFARGVLDLGITQIPAPTLLTIALFLLLNFLLTRTRFGANVYAVGGGAASARLAGIRVDRVKIGVFVLAGVVVALAAVVYTARLGNGQPQGMIGYELDAIAAVVIGGTSFSGGRGSLWRTVLGALLIGVLDNAVSLMQLDFNLKLAVKGATIILAVLVDYYSRGETRS
ncbi:MAG: ABC transporter permease [Anaerolineae bacterium]|nr:ABC transporter permease [Anaerolineae bacterium]MDW8172688.1 ABC transporter permease [Anaerolineae bacterium]